MVSFNFKDAGKHNCAHLENTIKSEFKCLDKILHNISLIGKYTFTTTYDAT